MRAEPPRPTSGGRNGRRPAADRRPVAHAISGHRPAAAAWRRRPHDVPPWQTVYGYVRMYRRLGKGHEHLTATREAMIWAAMTHLMLRRLPPE